MTMEERDPCNAKFHRPCGDVVTCDNPIGHAGRHSVEVTWSDTFSMTPTEIQGEQNKAVQLALDCIKAIAPSVEKGEHPADCSYAFAGNWSGLMQAFDKILRGHDHQPMYEQVARLALMPIRNAIDDIQAKLTGIGEAHHQLDVAFRKLIGRPEPEDSRGIGLSSRPK